MSFPGAPVFLLPPRPALRDWPLAGACAGLLLALAELLLASPSLPPPTLAILGVVSLAVGLALAALGLGLALRMLRQRPSHSELVAWVAGLIALAAVASLVLPRPGVSRLGSLGALLAGALAAALAARAAGQLADRSERSGIPANALLCWGAAALVIAVGERLLLGGSELGWLSLPLLGSAVLAGAVAAGAVFTLARRRGSSRPRASFGVLLTVLASLTLAAAFAPAALPWLLADRAPPPPVGAPANILVLAFGAGIAVSDASEARELGALGGWTGIRYEPRVPEPERALEAVLTLPDGSSLVPALADDGYRTAAIFADPSLGQEVGAREVDARPGARVRLERDLRWLAVAPWLAGPGRRLLARLGMEGEGRSPEQLASDARGWLLGRAASPIPFFLLVDFRCRDGVGAVGGAREEASIASLLDHLDQVRLAERTVVVLAQTGGPRDRPLRVVVRRPLAWPGVAGSPTASRRIEASELGAALRQTARSDGTTPIPFPGVVRIQLPAPILLAQAVAR
jgi:hypothetical protein